MNSDILYHDEAYTAVRHGETVAIIKSRSVVFLSYETYCGLISRNMTVQDIFNVYYKPGRYANQTDIPVSNQQYKKLK